MFKVEITPYAEHCIETVARRRYAELLQILLGNDPTNSQIEEELEILRLFLETADLRKLRAESEKYLIEGKIVHFNAYIDDTGLKYELSII
jgi:hypothetical protein